jgi:hypothetical protein
VAAREVEGVFLRFVSRGKGLRYSVDRERAEDEAQVAPRQVLEADRESPAYAHDEGPHADVAGRGEGRGLLQVVVAAAPLAAGGCGGHDGWFFWFFLFWFWLYTRSHTLFFLDFLLNCFVRYVLAFYFFFLLVVVVVGKLLAFYVFK